MAQEPTWLKQFEKVGPAPAQGGAPESVFVAAPGAAEEAQRREQQAALDTARTGVTLEGGARASREEVRGAAKDLRDQFEKQKPVVDYQTALPAYTTILNLAAGKPNKASDFTIVTLFNKVQDPGSAVLGGERDAAVDVSTLLEKYKTQLAGLFDPEVGFVSDDARRQFVSSAHALMTERRRGYDAMRTRYSEIAQAPEYGVRPELVVGRHFGEPFFQEIVDSWPKVFPQSAEPTTQGGAEGPRVSVTPEQSKEYFGYVAYDENGNVVGGDYEGGVYDSTGEYKGLSGIVTSDDSPVNVQDQSAPSFYGSVANAITGEDRATQITESLPDWTQMPEGSQINLDTIKTALGTAFGGSPQEIAQIVQSNFPGTVVWQDAKGNYILRSAMDGKDYAIKPGFQVSDIPRALNIAGVGAMTGGRTVLGTAAREAGAQALIEGGQSSVGGTFNPEDVLVAGGLGAAGKTIENAVPGALKMVRDMRGGGATSPTGGAPVAPIAPTGGASVANIPQAVDAAQAANIPVMTSDVATPTTFVGRSLQQAGERIPFAGTGGLRQAQQEARKDATTQLLADYGVGDPAIAGKVAKSLKETRNAQILKYDTAKKEVIDRLSGAGTVPVENAIKAIDGEISQLRRRNTDAASEAIAELEKTKAALQGRDLFSLEAYRKDELSKVFADENKFSPGARDMGEQALKRIYDPVNQDMGAFIKATGEPKDFAKWKIANARLSESAQELKKSALKGVLRDADQTPEAVWRLLFSEKPSDVAALYRNLGPQGKAAAKAAIIDKAFRDVVGPNGTLDDVTPDQFLQAMKKRGSQIRIFFSGDEGKRVTGLIEALKLTARAGKAGVVTDSGQQVYLPLGMAALADALGGGGAATATAATVGILSRGYESAAVRKAVMRFQAATPKEKAATAAAVSAALAGAFAAAMAEDEAKTKQPAKAEPTQ